MFRKIFDLINPKANKGEINASSVKSMTVSADFIAVNTNYGHYEIGNEIGVTKTIQIDKYKIKIVGGIIVGIEEVQNG